MNCHENRDNADRLYSQARKRYQENAREGFLLMRKAARKGSIHAYGWLGAFFYYGLGTRKNVRLAAEWSRKGCEAGDLSEQYNYALCLLDGDGVKQNKRLGAALLRPLALAGDVNSLAAAAYGQCLLYGDGVKRDRFSAAKFLAIAAHKSVGIAQYLMGLCYENGWGVERNWREAGRWYALAARKGDQLAAFRAGFVLHDVAAVRAIRYYEQAAGLSPNAESRSLDAIYNLALLYDLNHGKLHNARKAAALYAEAAKEGLPEAQCNLAVMLLEGDGVKQDIASGLRWLRKAALGGDKLACRKLGRYYMAGVYVKRNRKAAKRWLEKARGDRRMLKLPGIARK